MPKIKPHGTSRYSIISVEGTREPNTYIVTIARDGTPVGKVTVSSTSSSSAYFNDPEHFPGQGDDYGRPKCEPKSAAG
jgi:hypothetical protein